MSSERDLVVELSLKNSTWTHKGLHGVLHTFFPVGRSVILGLHDFLGERAQPAIFFVKDNYIHWYWRDEDLARLREEFFSRLQADPNYLQDLQRQWRGKLRTFDRIRKKVDDTDLQQLSVEELAGLYDQFYEAYTDEYRCFMSLGDALSMHADRYLVPEFEKVLGDDFTKAFPKLVTTRYPSFVEEEAQVRYKLLEVLREKGKVPRADLEKHAQEFFYISNNYAKGVRLTADNFAGLLNEDLRKNVEAPHDTRAERLKERQQLVEKYHLSAWQQTLLLVMDEFFAIQDTRKKYVLISNYYQFEFLREAERRGGISFELLQSSIYPEYQEAVAGTLPRETLVERQEFCLCIHRPHDYEIVTGDEARQAFAYFQAGTTGETELKGMVASWGKARGKVKIILKIHDLVNMDKGDVLVTSMTRPEMVPAMKLAAAVVTDEGGVTSHAAIVSRELGIPCVIGTKTATKVLKNGDEVEVDAEKGIVRKL